MKRLAWKLDNIAVGIDLLLCYLYVNKQSQKRINIYLDLYLCFDALQPYYHVHLVYSELNKDDLRFV